MPELPSRPFLTAELPSLGLTRADLRALLRAGVVRRVLHGVLCRTDLEDTVELRARAAALVLPDRTVVCDRSAAWLWGVDCFSLAEHAVTPRLEVVAVDGRDRTRRVGCFGGKRDLLPDEICELDGIPVTTPLRTACDLACLHGRSTALAVLDAFRREHGLTCADYERHLRARFAGRRGVVQARELASYAAPDAESQAESWTRLAIIDFGLPPPQTQVWVHVPGLGWVRLDMAYERLKVAIEYDGEEFHSSAADRAADQHRRDLLRAEGWIVIVVRKSDLRTAAVDDWLVELREAIEARTPSYRRRYPRAESRGPRRR